MLVPVDLNSCLFTQNEFGNCIYMPEEGGREACLCCTCEAARKDRRKPPARSLQSLEQLRENRYLFSMELYKNQI